ncbi:MAG: molybdate ABC transporter substrate-binding protein [Limnobacter sp.]|uniref:molybdate ABC transporter substrate-binding protein n=1 Tax=Limnobacter sp. TaxID=2003368 RepID=UPI0022BF751D|nr:molybdate ABC transporter substrate-binding protein [Limnobacter sp.]MCZ8014553.1 molybdate ABC transporter substrate-binding protein [Limnobacter sp.]
MTILFRVTHLAVVCLVFAACIAGLPLHAQAQSNSRSVPTLAAASDLKFAIEEVAAQFEKETGQKLRLVFGSSGNFYSQILQGAPFHLYMSADESFVFKLADAGKTEDRGKLYAQGRIGLFVPKGSALKADGELNDLAAALKDGRLKKFAIASPEHAPYGMRAMEALEHAGLWQAIEPRLVIGENISQAAQFATSGSTQGGIIAYSLALAPQIGSKGDFALIPETWHKPLAQRMVLMKNAPEPAKAFYQYLGTPGALAILRKYGFEVPAR